MLRSSNLFERSCSGRLETRSGVVGWDGMAWRGRRGRRRTTYPLCPGGLVAPAACLVEAVGRQAGRLAGRQQTHCRRTGRQAGGQTGGQARSTCPSLTSLLLVVAAARRECRSTAWWVAASPSGRAGEQEDVAVNERTGGAAGT